MTLQSYNSLMQQIDLVQVDHSMIHYHRGLMKWFKLLLTELNHFETHYHSALTIASELQYNLQQNKPQTPPPSVDEMIQKRITIQLERHLYSSIKIDCSLEQIKKDLNQFLNEVLAQNHNRLGSRTLSDLQILEQVERPSFQLVTEHTYQLLYNSCDYVISFAQKQEWIRYAFMRHNDLTSIHLDDVPSSEQNIRLMLLDQFLFTAIEALFEGDFNPQEIELIFSGDDHKLWDHYRSRLLEDQETNPLKRKRSLLLLETELFQNVKKIAGIPNLMPLLQAWQEQIIQEDLIDLQIYLLKHRNNFGSDLLHQVTRLKKFKLTPQERQKRYQSLLDQMIQEAILIQE